MDNKNQNQNQNQNQSKDQNQNQSKNQQNKDQSKNQNQNQNNNENSDETLLNILRGTKRAVRCTALFIGLQGTSGTYGARHFSYAPRRRSVVRFHRFDHAYRVEFRKHDEIDKAP